MICDKCNSCEAVFHLTNISGNIQTELHLCNRCASQVRLDAQVENNAMYIKTILSLVEKDDLHDLGSNTICLNCGLTDMELSLYGKPGCPSCYKYFKSILQPISAYSDIKKYSGKKPLNHFEVMSTQNENLEFNRRDLITLESAELEKELKIAVVEERYEDAAKLRDAIKEVKTVE